jgi:hypothetical protein
LRQYCSHTTVVHMADYTNYFGIYRRIPGRT